MALQHSTLPRRNKGELIVGAGWRVFVNWVPPAATPGLPVPLFDALGQPLGNDLSDGQEVEIMSWRPRSRHGLAYQIRRLSDGSEWWIDATYLRRLETATGAASARQAARQED